MGKAEFHPLPGYIKEELEIVDRFSVGKLDSLYETIIGIKDHGDNRELILAQSNMRNTSPFGRNEIFITLGYTIAEKVTKKKNKVKIKKPNDDSNIIRFDEHSLNEIGEIDKKWLVFLNNEKMYVETALIKRGNTHYIVQATQGNDLDIIFLGKRNIIEDMGD